METVSWPLRRCLKKLGQRFQIVLSTRVLYCACPPADIVPLNCDHNCDDHGLLDFKSAVQYMKHFIYHFSSILHGLIRTHKCPAPNVSGFIAQLVRASHRYREVTGWNPVEVLTFSGFYTQLLKFRWSWFTWVKESIEIKVLCSKGTISSKEAWTKINWAK